MEGTLMFALTPRAGRWNHRFIVPVGSRWSDQTLSRLADEAGSVNAPASVIAARTTVVQATTGRTGEELLVLKDSRLGRLNRAAQQVVQAALDERAEQLEFIVRDRVDWDKAGRDLTVERPELSHWSEELDHLVNKLLRDRASLAESRPKCSSQIVVLLALVGLAIVSVALWRHRFAESDLSNAPVGDKVLEDVAGLVGLDCHGRADSLLKREVQEQLSVMFDWTVNEMQLQAAEQPIADTLPPPESTSIESILKILYQTHFNLSASEEIEVLLSDDGFRQTLKRLFPPPSHEFDPTGLLPPEHRMTGRLRNMDAIRLRQIASTLAQIHALGQDRLPNEGTYGAFFRQIANLDESVLSQPHSVTEAPLPRFFLDQDVELAQTIETLFNGEPLASLLNTDPDSDRGLVEMTRIVGRQYSMGEKQQLSHWRLELKRQEVAGDTEALKAYALLDQLVATCKEAADGA